MMYDLTIVGGGPAGVAAAVYAARKRVKAILIIEEWGGQSTVSVGIENWIGTPTISGDELARALRTHVESCASDVLEIRSGLRATSLRTFDDHVQVGLSKGEPVESKTLIVSSGASRRKLEIPGAAEFDQRGLTYCASCDGPLFAGKDVAVIGGGNAAFETALQLLAYCKSVTLLNRSDALRADEISIAAARSHDNMRIVMNAEPSSIEGGSQPGGFVTGVRYRDTKTAAEQTLPVEGVFVEIGLLPNTNWIGETLAKNQIGQIVVDPRTQKASHTRVWAAGDCADGLYHQNNIAAGDAIKALEDVYLFLHKEVLIR